MQGQRTCECVTLLDVYKQRRVVQDFHWLKKHEGE
jgi:hypothetical protein